MPHVASQCGGLRPDWWFEVVGRVQCQLLVTTLTQLDDLRSLEKGLREHLPPPMTRLEQYALEGLIREAVHRSCALDALSSNRAAVRAAASLIISNPGHHWTVQSLAQTVALNRNALASQFKTALGISISDFIRAQRIRAAKELLMTSDSKLYAVASNVGFQSARTFYAVFTKLTGETPGAYRERIRRAPSVGVHDI
jgi:AraC-like DNA-binding protein